MRMTRRGFLKAAGVTGALSLVGSGPGRAVLRTLTEVGEDLTQAGGTRYIKCGVCGAGCVLVAHLNEDGRIVKIEGDPRDWVSHGRPCIKGRTSFRILYDPDRLKKPLKRTNQERGLKYDENGAVVGVVDPGWVEVSWDQALDEIAEKIAWAIREFGPHSVVFIGHGKGKDLASLIGTPNVVKHHTTCHSTRDAVVKPMFGGGLPIADFEHSKLILSFGHDMPGKSKNPFVWEFAEARRRGARVIVFDPRLSATANLADEWIPIKPGTDAAVLMAMLNVVLSEGLYDEEFVRKYTNGPHLVDQSGAPVKDDEGRFLVYDEASGSVVPADEAMRPALMWNGEHEGRAVKTALKFIADGVSQYTPEWASEKSGVPAEKIVEIAREFAFTKPACIPYWKRDGGLGPNRGQGVEALKAAAILMALTGNVEVRGGWVFNRTAKGAIAKVVSTKAKKSFATLYPIPDEYRGKIIDEGERFSVYHKYTKEGLYQKVWYNILHDDPYPVKVLIIAAQSLASTMNYRLVEEAIRHVVENGGIVVNINIYPDEMATLADYVLPDRTFYSSSGIGFSKSFDITARINWIEGVSDPFPDTKGNSSIFKELAFRIGAKLGIDEETLKAEYLPESMVISKDEKLQRQIESYSKKYGVQITLDELREKKVISVEWKPKYLSSIGTASGKIEIYPIMLLENGYNPLPTWRDEFTVGDLGDGEFILVSSVFAMNRHAKNVNVEAVRWVLEKHHANRIWLHPEAAARLGVTEGDEVIVEAVRCFYSPGDGEFVEASPARVKGRVHVTNMIRPGCVFVPHGLAQLSPFMSSHGFAPADGAIKPVYANYSDPSGSSADQDAVVRVYRVG